MDEVKFFRTIERTLRPVYEECFSAETRKTRNIVLVIGAVLILQAVGAITVAAKDVKLFPGLQVAFTITGSTYVRWMLVALCLFFCVLFWTRSYIEWHRWRLTHEATIREFLKVFNAAAKRQNSLFREYMERLSKAAQAEGVEATELLEAAESNPSTEEKKQLEAALLSAHKLMMRASRSWTLRFWLELVFPLAFAVASISIASFARVVR